MSSRYKGVSRHAATGRWSAQAWINGKNVYLGLFDDEEAAARAYDDKVRGLGRQLNFGAKRSREPACIESGPTRCAPRPDWAMLVCEGACKHNCHDPRRTYKRCV